MAPGPMSKSSQEGESISQAVASSKQTPKPQQLNITEAYLENAS